MSIHPLPQFEKDLKDFLDEKDRETYERLRPPETCVVRFGALKLIGEFPANLSVKPGCGSKLVIKTFRGTEIGELLTSTCPNAGCSKSVTRKQMLEYIDNSGGKDYPFYTDGKVLRIATVDDLNTQQKLDEIKKDQLNRAKMIVKESGLDMRVVDVEPILGSERLTIYFTAEDRVDFRNLVPKLASEFHTRVDLRQVGARDEARLVADYERCGQHCCCQTFLKVLKPVSMRSAKVQKATLDPLKISGRCGRLMCCLRYEDQTYAELKKRLPHRKTQVGTPEGDGIVIDSQILTQLVLVELDATRKRIAVPVEELVPVGTPPTPPSTPSTPSPSSSPSSRPDRHTDSPSTGDDQPERKKKRRRRRKRTDGQPSDQPSNAQPDTSDPSAEPRRKKKKKKRRKPDGTGSDTTSNPNPPEASSSEQPTGDDQPSKKKKRRRRKRRSHPNDRPEGPNNPPNQ